LGSAHRRVRIPSFVSIGTGESPGLLFATSALLAGVVLLGGGTRQGLWSDAIPQIGSLLFLVFLVLRNSVNPAIVGDRLLIGVVCAMLLLPLVQMVPLPPSVWTALPGREIVASAFAVAGQPLPWLGISLDPAATWRAFAGLLPPLALFLAVAELDHLARRSLSVLLIGLGIASVLIGLAQLMQGPASPLRFYPVTNTGDSVGFFANRNHYAALLYCLIPLSAAWVVGFLFDRRPERIFGIVVCALIYALFILGLGMARSRAGIFLAIVAALASLFVAANNEPRFARRGLFVVVAATVLGIILVVHYAFFQLLSRLDDDVLADYRFAIGSTTWEAVKAFQPFGSGFGTFENVYRIFERPQALLPAYVNQAHDDWLQLWLEGGWPALAILAGFLVWFARAAIRAWRSPVDEGRALDRALAQAGSVAATLVLVHSVMDYPLRTTAMMSVFAMCLALLVPPPKHAERRHAPPRHHPGAKHHPADSRPLHGRRLPTSPRRS
jgi:O-antigen ligase